jgi:hypothetical protein
LSLSSEAGCEVLLFPGFYGSLKPQVPVAVHELPLADRQLTATKSPLPPQITR